MSAAQDSSAARLREHHRSLADPSVLNLSYLLGVEGPLDLEALRASFSVLNDLHPMLGRFDPWDGVDFREVEVPSDCAALDVLVDAELGRPLNPALDKLMRVVVARLGEGTHLLVLIVHHAAADAWSLRLYSRCLSAAYAAIVSGGDSPPAPPAAASKVAAVAPSLAAELESLRAAVGGWPAACVDPFQPHPAGQSPWFTARLFDATAVRTLSRHAAACRMTTFALVASAAAAAVRESFGLPGVVLGTTVSGRRSTADWVTGGAFYRGAVLAAGEGAGPLTAAIAAAVDRRATYEAQLRAVAEGLGLPEPAEPAIYVCGDEHPLAELKLHGTAVFPVAMRRRLPDSARPARSPSCGRVALHWRGAPTGGSLAVFFEPALAEPALALHRLCIARLAAELGGPLPEAHPSPWMGEALRCDAPFAEAVSPVIAPAAEPGPAGATP
jgi:hypothetical protein